MNQTFLLLTTSPYHQRVVPQSENANAACALTWRVYSDIGAQRQIVRSLST